MSIRENICHKITTSISKSIPNKSKEEMECIQYGINIFLCNISKLIILLLIAYFLGITKYFIISFISINSIKMMSGGVHAKTSTTCLLFSILVFYLPVYMSIVFNISICVKSILCVISFLLILKYAPADTEEKPYINNSIRKTLKIKACLMTLLLIGISFIIKNKIISNIVFCSILIDSQLITPYTYKLFNRRYRNYESYC